MKILKLKKICMPETFFSTILLHFLLGPQYIWSLNFLFFPYFSTIELPVIQEHITFLKTYELGKKLTKTFNHRACFFFLENW